MKRMNDAISRSNLIKLCRNLVSGTVSPNDIARVPGIDAVPVVRCVDCKYRCTMVCPMYHTETCLDDLDGFDDYDVDRTDNDGFCHLGERWEGEEDD